MGEEVLVGGTKECFVAEVAGGEEAVVQAAAVAYVEPLALGAVAVGDMFCTTVGLCLFDAG